MSVLACLCALGVAGMAMAGDPFEDARYYMGVKNNAEAVRLIDSGQFDINMQTSEGYTLLHYAADNGNLEMVRELIRRGADVNLRTARGSTPWDMAISEIVRAEIAKAGGRSGRAPPVAAPPRPVPSAPAANPATPVKPAPAATPEDPRRKMCNARHYSSSSLCSDSTCKMREYRKWQTCLKTGSYY